MTAVVVTIGRNVGDVPMTTDRWEGFQHELRAAIPGTVHYVGTGHGIYNGMREDSYTVHADIPPGGERALRNRLARLAARYEQECIALTIGATDLVYAVTTAA